MKSNIEKRQPRSLAIHWGVLGVLSLFLVCGAVAARISGTTVDATLVLSVGQTIRVSVFRLLPHVIDLSIDFQRKNNQKRPELGEYASRQREGYLQFDLPGQPVVLQVRGPLSSAEYEALPATASGINHISRDLVIRDKSRMPNQFLWPPNNAARPVLPWGWSTIDFTVVSVGESLVGEAVRVVIEPPLGFKSSWPGYGFLWWFFFWPVYALPLVFYGAYLSWRTWGSRWRRRG